MAAVKLGFILGVGEPRFAFSFVAPKESVEVKRRAAF